MRGTVRPRSSAGLSDRVVRSRAGWKRCRRYLDDWDVNMVPGSSERRPPQRAEGMMTSFGKTVLHFVHFMRLVLWG